MTYTKPIIAIDVGHNVETDTGAIGTVKGQSLREDDVVMAVGKELQRICKDNATRSVWCLPSSATSVGNSLQQRVNASNKAGATIYVSLHCNVYQPTDKAMGTEVYAVSVPGKALAAKILENLCEFGWKSRGVKTSLGNATPYVVAHTNAIAVLVELCFLDSTIDRLILSQHSYTEIAQAIYDAIVDGVPTNVKPSIDSIPTTFSGKVNWSNPASPISKYFKVVEVTKGDPARAVIPGSDVERRVLALAQELDKIRSEWGQPIMVSSWYRPTAVNAAIGGARNSQHINGCAVDVYTDGAKSMAEFQSWLDANWFGALGYGLARGFVHLDMRNGKGWRTGGEKGVRWNY